MAANGNQAASELQRLLAESEQRNREANDKIVELERTIVNNQARFETE